MVRINYFFVVLFVGLCMIDFTTAKIQVTTQPGHLQVEWAPPNISAQSWDVTYDVMVSVYHGVVHVIGTSYSVNVSTDQYPGSMCKVSVYQVVNGTRQLYGNGFGRANCSTTYYTVLGDTNRLRSPGYSRDVPSGVLCTWNFVGSDDTWYRIQVSDFNIHRNESCGDYVNVDDITLCNNSMWITSKIITNSSFAVKLFTKSAKGDPFEFTVTAVHRLLAPTNVTANVTDDVINVTWEPPSYHPDNFTYTLRLAHYPFTSFSDMTLDGNATFQTILLTSHFGQNFTVQIRSASADVISDFGTPIFVRSSCNKDYFIKETKTLSVTSEQFPNNYFPDVRCTYTFKTDDEFILRILTHTLDISGTSFCRVPPFLEIKGERFCSDHLPSQIMVYNSSTLEMTFDSGLNTRGSGFNVSIQSVAQQPSPPQNAHATVEQDVIRISWAPPAHRQAYVSLYTVQYFLPPHTPGATVTLTQESRNFTVDTHGYSGRLYVIRLSASSDGGASAFTAPLYVRASCGHEFHLERHQEALILSPGSVSAYSPAVVCNWSVVAPPNHWLKLIVQEFELEDSVNCTKDYLTFSGQEPRCGNQTSGSSIFRENSLEFRFISDYDIESRGFRLVIISEGPTPGAPENVSMQPTQYGIVVQWQPPSFRTEFVNGYSIIYMVGNDGSNHTDRVMPNAHYHVIDMTSYIGRIVYAWIRSIGDVEDSVAVPVGKIRTFCGGIVEIGLEPVYISSPGYGKATPAGILCDWSIRTPNFSNAKLRISLIRLEIMSSGYPSCGSFLIINNVTRCAGIGEAEEVELTEQKETTLTFQTGDADVESRFLIRIDTFEQSAFSPSPLQSSSTRVAIFPSSTSACATCAAIMTTLSPLLTSLPMIQYVSSVADIDERRPLNITRSSCISTHLILPSSSALQISSVQSSTLPTVVPFTHLKSAFLKTQRYPSEFIPSFSYALTSSSSSSSFSTSTLQAAAAASLFTTTKSTLSSSLSTTRSILPTVAPVLTTTKSTLASSPTPISKSASPIGRSSRSTIVSDDSGLAHHYSETRRDSANAVASATSFPTSILSSYEDSTFTHSVSALIGPYKNFLGQSNKEDVFRATTAATFFSLSINSRPTSRFLSTQTVLPTQTLSSLPLDSSSSVVKRQRALHSGATIRLQPSYAFLTILPFIVMKIVRF